MSLITIYYRKPSALERVGINAANQTAFTAANTAIRFVKMSDYATRLLTEPDILSHDEMLSLDGRLSPFKTGAGGILRNTLELKASEDLMIKFEDVQLQVEQVNTIKETPLTVKKGTFKEYIQANDYSVTMRGNLISERSGAFPYDLLQSLISILQLPQTFTIASKYLLAFGITKVALRRALFDQAQQKYSNIMPFNLTFTSDEEHELQVD